jgi:hypothetical protein
MAKIRSKPAADFAEQHGIVNISKQRSGSNGRGSLLGHESSGILPHDLPCACANLACNALSAQIRGASGLRMSNKELLHIGPHTAWIEPPDIMASHWRGEISPDQVLAMYDEIEKLAAMSPNVFLLNIVRHATVPSLETRRVFSMDPRAQCIRGVAVVGASFHLRVIATMLMNAAGLVGRGPRMQSTFVATEDEGRKWIATKRLELVESV